MSESFSTSGRCSLITESLYYLSPLPIFLLLLMIGCFLILRKQKKKTVGKPSAKRDEPSIDIPMDPIPSRRIEEQAPEGMIFSPRASTHGREQVFYIEMK